MQTHISTFKTSQFVLPATGNKSNEPFFIIMVFTFGEGVLLERLTPIQNWTVLKW